LIPSRRHRSPTVPPSPICAARSPRLRRNCGAPPRHRRRMRRSTPGRGRRHKAAFQRRPAGCTPRKSGDFRSELWPAGRGLRPDDLPLGARESSPARCSAGAFGSRSRLGAARNLAAPCWMRDGFKVDLPVSNVYEATINQTAASIRTTSSPRADRTRAGWGPRRAKFSSWRGRTLDCANPEPRANARLNASCPPHDVYEPHSNIISECVSQPQPNDPYCSRIRAQ